MTGARRLDGITDSMDTNLSTLREIVKDRELQSMRSQRGRHNLATEQQPRIGNCSPRYQWQRECAFATEARCVKMHIPVRGVMSKHTVTPLVTHLQCSGTLVVAHLCLLALITYGKKVNSETLCVSDISGEIFQILCCLHNEVNFLHMSSICISISLSGNLQFYKLW